MFPHSLKEKNQRDAPILSQIQICTNVMPQTEVTLKGDYLRTLTCLQ